MGQTYIYTVKSKLGHVLKKIKTLLKDYPKIPFSVNEKKGNLKKWKGFEANYSIEESSSGTEIRVEITKKPFPIPWSIIKYRLDSETRKW